MTQVPTVSYLQTYLSMDIIKTPQYLETFLYPNHQQGQNKFTIEDDKDTKKVLQTKKLITVRSKIPASIRNCTMYKTTNHLTKQFNIMISTRCGSLLKGTSGQTLVLPRLPHCYVDFIVDLVLVCGVIIRQVVFVTISTFAYNFGTFV